MYKLSKAVSFKVHGLLKKNSVKRLIITILLLPIASYGSALQTLNDAELASITGQSLLSLKSIAPNESGNPNTGIGFTRLSLVGKMEINANIDSLKLGCTGANQTNCDVDISQLRLAGAGLGDKGAANAGPATDAVLTNPFRVCC